MLQVNAQLTQGTFELNMQCDVAGITAMFGPSGSGKTTLLHAIAGLTTPTTGRIAIDGEPVFDRTERINRKPHLRRVGMVFQNARLLPHRTVRQNLRYGLPRRNHHAEPFTTEEVARALDITDLLDQPAWSLSGGQAQRVALGRALLAQPRVLLLDEPLSALDDDAKALAIELIREAHRRWAIPVLLVSHSLKDLLRLTDRLVLIDSGRCVGQGRYLDLVQQEGTCALLRASGLINVLPVRRSLGPTGTGISRMTTEVRTGRPVPIRGLADVPGPAPSHVMLRAEDIALALAPVEYISMQNQLVGVVESIHQTPGRRLCIVNVGPKLIVEVTDLSFGQLELAVGKRVWCLFKAASLQYAQPHDEPADPTQRPAGAAHADRARDRDRSGPLQPVPRRGDHVTVE